MFNVHVKLKHLVLGMSLLQLVLPIEYVNCSTLGGVDREEITIEDFCSTDTKNCSPIGNETAPDEVEYVEERDSDTYFGCRNSKWSDPTRVCRMNKKEQCDKVSKCATDECGCTVDQDTNLFMCKNTTIEEEVVLGGCLTDKFLCNGYSHCPNAEDEFLCYNVHRCEDDQGGNKWVPNFRVCDGYYHCKDFSDEKEPYCKSRSVSTKKPRKYIRCRNGNDTVKIKITQLCNGNRDCTEQCEDYDTLENCWPYDDEEDCSYDCMNSSITIPSYFLCDTYPQCPYADDECGRNCNYSSFWNNTSPDILDRVNGSHYFNSTPAFCEKFDPSACTSDNKKFRCDNGDCIAQLKVCNTLNNCGDWSDEKHCLGRFYCTNENPVYVPWENVCDGATDCYDGSDECNNCNFDILASDESLIANLILQKLVWFMGIVALLGNMILVLTKGHELKTMGSKMNSVTKISILLLVNLAISDFLMGVYLIGIAAMELKLHGNYCMARKSWTSSLSCKVLGSLCLLSSECSIFMMTLITLHRLVSVIFPRKVSTLGKKGLSVWYAVIILVWLIVLGLAWLPNMNAFQEYFVTEAYYNDNSFFGNGNKSSLTKYAWKYMTDNVTDDMLMRPPEDVSMTWDEIFKVIESSGVGPPYRYYGLMGFYSSHGVCLHKLFSKKSSPSWAYSLFLNVFNSLCFIFIVVAYSHILTVSKKLSPSRSKGSSRMSRKIQRLVFTDALCWIPTCITAYLYIAGVEVNDQMYAYTAILILPINSCLNPIVYTDIIDRIHVWFLKTVMRGSDTYSTANTAQEVAHNPKDHLTAIRDTTVISRETPVLSRDVVKLAAAVNGAKDQAAQLKNGSTLTTESSLANLSPSVIYRTSHL